MPQKIYNFRLSHTRRIIESAFGELAQRWLVNENALAWKLPTTEKVIMSTICLHNYLIDIEMNEVLNRWNRVNENNDIDENNMIDVGNQINALPEIRIRQNLTDYFISNEGAVPWQWNRI